MKSFFGATGLDITVTDKDLGQDRLECICMDYKRPKVILKIMDKVPKREDLSEEGFHIQGWPPNTSLRNSTKIFVYLSRKRWHELTTVYDSEMRGGFFCSRCKYDRFHISYNDYSKE